MPFLPTTTVPKLTVEGLTWNAPFVGFVGPEAVTIPAHPAINVVQQSANVRSSGSKFLGFMLGRPLSPTLAFFIAPMPITTGKSVRVLGVLKLLA